MQESDNFPSENEQRESTLESAWWLGMGAHLFDKLYGSARRSEFYRDRVSLASSIGVFRERCKARGWEIPLAYHGKAINRLVTRCRDALAKKNMESTAYIPGYFRKAITRYVDEVADECSLRFKIKIDPKKMDPEARNQFMKAMIGICESKLQTL